ncbi:MAG TPA: glutathione transferase GstA [Polyangiaceae bacterium]|nr:glutathione transferase GstA [Polyangiaceae bacterium]
MKLYYAPGACSLAPHIVLREAGLPFDLVKVDLKAKKTETGDDYNAINPKGYVPALELDATNGKSGERLTEGPAITQYLADRVPEKRLAPPNGTLERARLHEWLNFITSELHKSFGPLFSPATPEDYKRQLKDKIVSRLTFVDQTLAKTKKPYLLGDDFSVADAYLFVVTNWSGGVGVDIQGLAKVNEFQARVRERPAVAAALRAEGLAK